MKIKKICEEERFYNLEDDSYYLKVSYKLELFLDDTKWEESGGIYSLQSTKYLTYFNLKSREFYLKI